jgi:peptide/nickel transport system substrate-binding protein
MPRRKPGGTVQRRTFSRGLRGLALVFALMMAFAACGGDDDDSGDGGGGGGEEQTAGPKGEAPDAGTPTPGGSIVYGLEANTNGGWCLAEAQLAISGIQVARAVYDTLTAPGADGEIHPFLAESVEPNANATVWKIKLREGIKFHDGSPLTAEVVKNNLDAYRGNYPGRAPQLFIFVFENIKDITVNDELNLTVTMDAPWYGFGWQLWSSARLGIMGQKQLDDKESCDQNLIGTGPFKKKSFTPGPSGNFVAEKNPNYWRKDKDGVPYPYLDQITFAAQESGPDRVKALQAKDYTVIHTSGALNIIDIRNDSSIRSIESDDFGEISYTMLNATVPPFNEKSAREAVAYATDREAFNEARNDGILTNASGPFAPGSKGYLEDTGFPNYDPARAAEAVAAYKTATGKDLAFTLTSSADPETLKSAELIQTMMQAANIKVDIQTIGDQTQYINQAIGKEYQAILWRNHPGGDPDLQYVWWHCAPQPADSCNNLVNFSGFNDPEINNYLDTGRKTNPDDPARTKAYEDLNKRFASQLWEIWGQYIIWSIAFQPEVHGILGPELPDGTGPFPGLATGHPVEAMWVKK